MPFACLRERLYGYFERDFVQGDDKEELNEFMRQTALHSAFRKQIDFPIRPKWYRLIFVGSRAACVFDAQATIVNGRHAVLYLWYDNEYGYSCQVYRVLEKMAGIKYLTYPPTDTGGL